MKRLTKIPIVAAFLIAISYSGTGTAGDWRVGDVFAAIGGGKYAVFDNNGKFKETITDPEGGLTTGCAFNNDRSQLYTTNFSNTKVVVFDTAHPHSLAKSINTSNPDDSETVSFLSESIAFYANGSYTVGHVAGDAALQQYDSADEFVQQFLPEIEDRGIDWHDPSSDRTVFYTSEGRRILRFDIGTGSQLADFALLPDPVCNLSEPSPPCGKAYALRLLPPGDSSGGLIVADFLDIKRLDGAGNVVQTYDVLGIGEPEDPGENEWFSLALDPNGTSFWAGIRAGDRFYRFNIETGARELGPIFIPAPMLLGGLCVLGERTSALTTSVLVCSKDNQAERSQCDSAGGAGYFVGYGPEFGDFVVCPCEGTDVTITVRDCNIDQRQRSELDNCFPPGTEGLDEISQSQSLVAGSLCFIQCIPIDGRRQCFEVCQ